MSEEQNSTSAVSLDGGSDDDEGVDVALDAELDDFDDEAFDLDDEDPVADELGADGIDLTDADGLDFDLEVDFGAAGNDEDAGEPEVDVEPEDSGDDDADVEAELLAASPDTPATTSAAAAIAAPADDRLARVEAVARALSEAQVTREKGRVRRKVTAATTGAGAVGSIPILLQLVDALHLSPELAALASTGAALIGAFLTGYLTPEREQVVAGSGDVRDLLDDATVPSTPGQTRASRARMRRESRRSPRRRLQGHTGTGRG